MSATANLHEAIEQYLALRRTLGFELRHESWWLPSFATYVEEQGSSVITAELAVRWAQFPADTSPAWWAHRLSAVRQFARHYQAFDPRTEIPAPDLLPNPKRRRTPHIYSIEEICALMGQAARLRRRLMAATYPALIGLLATTGMRVGEAVALDHNDVDWSRSRLHVRNSKFHKSRYVPLHEQTLTALRSYVRQRERLRPTDQVSPSFFVSSVGNRLIYNNVARTFARLVKFAGLKSQVDRPPRLHDMRHSFAVMTLRDWYAAGVDVETRLPALSTYLGHVSPTTTYWYLTATPELLVLASQRAERAWEVQP